MKETFSPIPARAIGDSRLSALDLRVLAAIASHDRMSKNGIGCTAGHGRLSALVGAHLKSLSRSIKTLAECGYIGGRANPLNPKSRCYFVIYNEYDAGFLKAATGNETVTSNQPKGNQLVPPQVTNSFHIGNRVEKNAQQNQRDASYNIFSEAIRDPVETENRFSETASFDAEDDRNVVPVEVSQGALREAPSGSVGAMLSMIERGIKGGKQEPFYLRYLNDVVASYSDAGNDEYGRAYRMLEQYGDELSGGGS